MNPFDAHGHLTDDALTALIRRQELPPLARLEIAEHLAYCDRCLQRYTELLTEPALLSPANSCREPLGRRIRQRTFRLLTGRYATAAAAVLLALTLLWGGEQTDLPSLFTQAETVIAETALPERWDSALNSLSGRLRDTFDRIDLSRTLSAPESQLPQNHYKEDSHP